MSNRIEAFPGHSYMHCRVRAKTPLYGDPRLTYFVPANWIYIAKAGTEYKIGCTSYSVDVRIKQVQKQYPERVIEQVCYALANEKRYNTERWFHRQLKEYRLDGEWFDISSQEAKDLLARLMVHDSKERRGSKFFRVRVLTNGHQ